MTEDFETKKMKRVAYFQLDLQRERDGISYHMGSERARAGGRAMGSIKNACIHERNQGVDMAGFIYSFSLTSRSPLRVSFSVSFLALFVFCFSGLRGREEGRRLIYHTRPGPRAEERRGGMGEEEMMRAG